MIYLALTVILFSATATARAAAAAASGHECRPPPYRSDMSVVYGLGFVEFGCPNRGGSYLLRCVDGVWLGYVPETCDWVRPTAPPTRPPPPPTVPYRPHGSISKCGPAPHRDDMLYYEGPEGRFVDYYCRPPLGGYFQPFAYRLTCRAGFWKGDLPEECPHGVGSYPKSQK